MTKPLTILGLESSCDDSAAAVVRVGAGMTDILSNIVRGQTALHAEFGGVVPEIAARAHLQVLDICVEEALTKARFTLSDLDAIAVTAGPGLIGGVVSGVMLAKGLALGSRLPLVGVNHLAGHALTPRLTHGLAYPYLMLLVSGGHCQFLSVEGHDRYTRLGGTIDDAPGEAFDKVARLIGLPQPGGPAIEDRAKTAPADIPLPRPLLDRSGCDMSFSGLKTAVLRARDGLVHHDGLTSHDQGRLAASFQAAVVDILAQKSLRAMEDFANRHGTGHGFAVAGGVAANQTIRGALETVCAKLEMTFVAPPMALCTDNAAMIAYAGAEALMAGHSDDMTLSARPRWPLDQSSRPMLGSGKKGAKA